MSVFVSLLVTTLFVSYHVFSPRPLPEIQARGIEPPITKVLSHSFNEPTKTNMSAMVCLCLQVTLKSAYVFIHRILLVGLFELLHAFPPVFLMEIAKSTICGLDYTWFWAQCNIT